MKGFVPTPSGTVDRMVRRLFGGRLPKSGARVLDPGCGHGAFIHGLLRWLDERGIGSVSIVGVELDPEKLRIARAAFRGDRRVKLVHADFLERTMEPFDYIVGNPPYVSIDSLSVEERQRYRRRFETARGRMDLYLLFWERALQLLSGEGRLVFITPEKFTYVESGRPLRQLLARLHVEEMRFAAEDTFPGLTTYPLITTVSTRKSPKPTNVIHRNGHRIFVNLPPHGESWQACIHGSPSMSGSHTLIDASIRISCGVATGADKIFLFRRDDLPVSFASYVHPTISGRELRLRAPLPSPTHALLTPYDRRGELLEIGALREVAEYLLKPDVRCRLEARTCASRKPWYAFHETPPIDEMLRPKILCKDITGEPQFWVDRTGELMPLHSTYYIVPRHPGLLEPLAAYLNSARTRSWLRANCQRAANNFLRMQSAVLKRLPLPDELAVEDNGANTV